jgi:hypothetical protein
MYENPGVSFRWRLYHGAPFSLQELAAQPQLAVAGREHALEFYSIFMTFLTGPEVHHCKGTGAIRCKRTTLQLYLLVTIIFVRIENNCLGALATVLMSDPCPDKFELEIHRSTSRGAVANASQRGLYSCAARLHWRASPALRKPMKAG